MSQSEGAGNSFATIELPEKTYFKIGEVAKLLEVEPYVLRYWETEFDVLEPDKTKSGQRVYQRDDIELLFQIRTLLYEEMFTIAGACRQLERNREGKPSYFDLGSESNHAAGTAVAGDEELRQQLESTRRQLAARETKLTDVRERVQQMERRIDEQHQQVDSSLETIATLEDELESIRGESDRLRDENETLRGQLNDARRQLGQKSGESATSSTIEELQREVATLEQKLEQAREKAHQRRRQRQREKKKEKKRRRQALNSLRRQVEKVETVAARAESNSKS